MQVKKYLKALAVLLTLVASVPASASASTTSDKSLGLYEYSWFIDGLNSYVFQNPYYMSKYKNTAFAERVGAVDGENMGGMYFSPLSWLTVGLYLGNPVNDNVWNSTDRESIFNVDSYSAKSILKTQHAISSQVFSGYQAEMLDHTIVDLSDPTKGSALVGTNTTSPSYREPLDQQNFNMLSSFDFGRWGAGVGFGYATSWKNKRTGDSTTASSDEYDFVNTQYSANIGGYYKINEKVSIDAGTSFVLYVLDNSFKKKTPTVSTKMSYQTDGAMDLGLNSRVNYQMTQNHRMHFNFSYMYMNRSAKGMMKVTDQTTASNDVDGQDTFSRTGNDFHLGVSDEFKMGPDVKAFIGVDTELELFNNSYSGKDAIASGNNLDKYSRSSTVITVPIIIGMEAKLSENWTGRFGLVQKIYQPVADSGKNTTSMGSVTVPTSLSDNSSSATIMSIGLGYKLGNSLTLDWLASTDLLVSGPYVVSGKIWTSDEPTPMALSFAVTYNFDSYVTSALAPESPKTDTSKPAGPAKR